MCGIVGAIAKRDIVPVLLEGLRRLEYRGYDSAGIAVIDNDNVITRVRSPGKISALEQKISQQPIIGKIGIAHTRWATHGKPSEQNAHPHICRHKVAVVHNGIIENHVALREEQQAAGFEFTSETDTEVIVHQIHAFLEQGLSLLESTKATIAKLEGAYALGVIALDDAEKMIAARKGSPLVIGLGIGENFIASDVSALLPVTQRFIFLEEGDIAEIDRENITVYQQDGSKVERPAKESMLLASSVERGEYRHYMLKEIYEQPRAVAETLEGRLTETRVLAESLGLAASKLIEQIEHVQIIACGTSFHAGLVAKYWFEALTGIPCDVEVASEYRYRKPVVRNNSILIAISQSGETADTLAALKEAKTRGHKLSLAICNAPESSLVRESDLCLMTRAGPEIGVASTKAFTTQLVALLMLVIIFGRQARLPRETEVELINELRSLPARIENVLELDEQIAVLAQTFADKHNALFLGRGSHYPIALEGALKLKEISYIHAEAYPAGELKHGPLALVDAEMPIIAVAPNNELLEKLLSNLQEVRARGGRLVVFADETVVFDAEEGDSIITIPAVSDVISPIIYTIPLQLFAYHVAVCKGTDVDQPRNLAKSVTVE